ncbi:MAG: hypothetical protein U5K79_26005 [Cyclobacteriaceae bacterium]|nr:hypothetical protein [Cyclobacteriaceae bacterium]
MGFPKTSSISFIERDSKFVTPSGSTTILEHDKLYVLSENSESLLKVYECLDIQHHLETDV